MFRNASFMLLSTLLRIASNVVVLMALARAWGPALFGEFMYPFTLAAIGVILVDYGFELQLVRNVSRQPERVHAMTGLALALKAVLAIAVGLLALPALFVYAPLLEGRGLLAVLWVANCLNSFGSVFNLAFRGLGRFEVESRNLLCSNAVLLAGVVGALMLDAGPLAIACTMLLAKASYLTISAFAYLRSGRPEWPRMSALTAFLREGFPFAAHVIFGTLYFQVDTLVLKHFMGDAAVGSYQAGMRVMAGGLILTDVLTNVYLNRMAAEASHGSRLRELGEQMLRHCALLGGMGWVAMAGLSTELVAFIYGEKYGAIAPYFVLLGAVLFMRYLATALGVFLTVVNRQFARMLAVMSLAALSLVLNILAVPALGIRGALLATLVTHLVLLAIYLACAWPEPQRPRFGLRGLALAAISCAACLLLSQPDLSPIHRIALLAITLPGLACFGIRRSDLSGALTAGALK